MKFFIWMWFHISTKEKHNFGSTPIIEQQNIFLYLIPRPSPSPVECAARLPSPHLYMLTVHTCNSCHTQTKTPCCSLSIVEDLPMTFT